MSRLTNPFTWAAELIDSGFSISDALRKVAEGRLFLTDPEDSTRHQEFDPLFKAPISINIEHHEIHEGSMYSVFVHDTAIANTETVEILLQAPAVASPQKRVHMIVEHEASTAHTFTILEGATYSSGGTVIGTANRFRGSVKTSAMQAAYSGIPGGSIVTGGSPVTLWSALHGSGKTVGGGSRGTEEWILEPGEEYLFQITSAGGGGSSCNAWIGLVWYEHTDG